MIRYLTFYGLLFIIAGCTSGKVPTMRYQAYPLEYSFKIESDSLYISVNNQLKCPVRIMLPDSALGQNLERNGFAYIEAEKKKVFTVYLQGEKTYDNRLQWRLGKPVSEPKIGALILPFPIGKHYKIIQGYNGKYSHQGPLSKYALDFDLNVGDTICSADEGFVVGLITKYSKNGKSKEWRDYANFITIYNPKTNVLTEYGHLKQDGALVNLGDFIKGGQAIAVAGNTGWSTTPHLHFVAFYRNEDWKAEPLKIVFKDNIEAEKLKRGDVVKRTN